MAKRKTSTTTWLVLGGGVALVGAGIYFLTRSPAAASTAALPVTATAGGSVVVYTDPASGRTYTRDQAADVACKLRAINHPTEAAFWTNLVTQHGGVLPC